MGPGKQPLSSGSPEGAPTFRPGRVSIRKAGWVRFRWTRAVPGKAKSFRVTRDRAGVNPAFTSQRCPACGHLAPESRQSQALFRCIACAYTDNADVNAAKNIAARHAVTARGGLGVARPVNREPQPAPLAS